MKPLDILWLAWLVFPVGAAMILLSVKRRAIAAVGLGLCLASAAYALRFRDAFRWQFDAIRGWSVEIPVQAGDYQVVFMQKPGPNYYETSLRVIRADGKAASLLIDGDDDRWVNPRVVREGPQSWIIADQMARESAPMIDATAATVSVHGWVECVFRLAELEYGEEADPSPARDRAE